MFKNSIVDGKSHCLNPRHRLFCEEFLANGMNGTKAARTLGYKNPSIIAAKLLKKAPIKRHIEQGLDRLINGDIRWRQWELIQTMWRLQRFNLLTASSKAKNGMIELDIDRFNELADEIGDCTSEAEFVVTEEKDGSKRTRVRIKLMSKDRNFDRLLNYYGMSVDRQDIRQTVGLDWDELARAASRNGDVVEGRIKALEERAE